MGLHDYRAVALLDLLQFAYRANRAIDYAVNMVLHYILMHLDSREPTTGSCLCTSALLQDKLSKLSVPDPTCSKITDS